VKAPKIPAGCPPLWVDVHDLLLSLPFRERHVAIVLGLQWARSAEDQRPSELWRGIYAWLAGVRAGLVIATFPEGAEAPERRALAQRLVMVGGSTNGGLRGHSASDDFAPVAEPVGWTYRPDDDPPTWPGGGR
jgi:hypothetical protein